MTDNLLHNNINLMIRIIKYLYYLFYRPKIFFPLKTYSTFGEDLILGKVFKKKGFYVDVGCYHPYEGSNTCLLYKKGWRGINIDPNPYSIELFKFSRPNDINLNFAVSSSSKKIKFYYRKEINMLNTIIEKQAKSNFPNGYFTARIKSKKLNDIIKETPFFKKEIDFLNIDVEGADFEVIKSLNFKIYKPKFICIEIHNVGKENIKNNITYKFLINMNYSLLWNHRWSFIFKRKLLNLR
jgi:FkbM family methyltransferase